MKPFYSDGTVARFALTHISSCGETLSFNLENLGHQIKLSEEAVRLAVRRATSSSFRWRLM